MKPLMRRLAGPLLALVALSGVALGITLATGTAAVVITHGVSMNPVYYQGDLVVVAKSPAYKRGDIVAYPVPGTRIVALHRIIGGDAGGFTIKGDNNQSIDAAHPSAQAIIGRAVLHVPRAGLWLQALTSPASLALITFILMAGGGTALGRHHKRRRRKAPMSRHTGAPRRIPAAGAVLRGLTAAAVLLTGLGAALAAPAWAGPPATTALTPGTAGRLDFSYTAQVGHTPAYDTTTVTSPDPVFRKITNTVDLHLSYQGVPGSMAVTADLNTPGGWHSSILLAPAETFTGTRHETIVTLDLRSIDAKALAGASATGLPAAPVTVTVTARIHPAAGADFNPGLRLALTPLQLSLAGGPSDLTVVGPGTPTATGSTSRIISLGPVSLTAATARWVSGVLLLAGLLAAGALLLLRRRARTVDEATEIRRRYASLLIRVHPMPAPAGRPVIDVDTFATLAKLAERYGLLVLHWARADVETFIVQDEGTTYRYRTGTPAPHTETVQETVNADA